MKRYTIIFSLVVGLMLLFAQDSYGQLYPERSKIRSGNKAYEKGEFEAAEEYYSRALALTPNSVEARFNLADARYKMELYDEAVQTLAPLKADTIADQIRSQAFYNEGNALFKQRKFEEALESYKSSLRINPSDTSAKFNLAYTQKMLENEDNQDGGGGGGGDDQDENQDENQDQDQNDQGDQGDQDQNEDQQDQNGDQNEDQGDQDQDQNGDQNQDQNQDQQDQQQGQSEAQMSQQEAEQMLQAIQESEDNTREKVKAESAKAQGSSLKNW